MTVKGANRSLICDLQRESSEFIPNDLIEIMDNLNQKISIENLLAIYGEENKETLQQYLHFLEEKEYGFYCDADEFDLFPQMDTTFDVPSQISNAVFDMEKRDIFCLKDYIFQIQNLGCRHVALVFYEDLEKKDFVEIFSYFKNSRIKSFEITCRYALYHDKEFIEEINLNVNQLTKITFTSAHFDEMLLWDNEIHFDRVFINKDISSFKACGVVEMKYFSTNLPKVIEAINHNSCLNRKISIDVNGEIRNCPSMPESYGNIKDTTLEEAINKPGFKKYWNLTKDDIEVCRDCEFRYICTDCRAYTERTHSKNGLDTSKPLKCGYNPYTGEWSEWSTNPLKEKAINFYGMQHLKK